MLSLQRLAYWKMALGVSDRALEALVKILTEELPHVRLPKSAKGFRSSLFSTSPKNGVAVLDVGVPPTQVVGFSSLLWWFRLCLVFQKRVVRCRVHACISLCASLPFPCSPPPHPKKKKRERKDSHLLSTLSLCSPPPYPLQHTHTCVFAMCPLSGFLDAVRSAEARA